MNVYELTKNRILELCGEKNYSIYQLAMKSSLPLSSVKNILYGKSKNPGIATIKSICDGFEITLSEFFDTAEFRRIS